MIQRIQTVFLFLVFLVAILLMFFPLASFHIDESVFQMNLFGFDGANHLDAEMPNIMAIGILDALLGIMALFAIFQFKNRKFQMKLVMIIMLINFGLLAAIFYYAEQVGTSLDIKANYDIAAYFPIVSVLFLIYANRNIRADEKLVRQSERLR